MSRKAAAFEYGPNTLFIDWLGLDFYAALLNIAFISLVCASNVEDNAMRRAKSILSIFWEFSLSSAFLVFFYSDILIMELSKEDRSLLLRVFYFYYR